MSPLGQITFISYLNAGRCSDKKLLLHCGILEKLEPGDATMVDRGFVVSNSLESQISNTIFPRWKKQLLKNDVNYSRQLASTRVHIEMVMRRIRV